MKKKGLNKSFLWSIYYYHHFFFVFLLYLSLCVFFFLLSSSFPQKAEPKERERDKEILKILPVACLSQICTFYPFPQYSHTHTRESWFLDISRFYPSRGPTLSCGTCVFFLSVYKAHACAPVYVRRPTLSQAIMDVWGSGQNSQPLHLASQHPYGSRDRISGIGIQSLSLSLSLSLKTSLIMGFKKKYSHPHMLPTPHG